MFTQTAKNTLSAPIPGRSRINSASKLYDYFSHLIETNLPSKVLRSTGLNKFQVLNKLDPLLGCLELAPAIESLSFARQFKIFRNLIEEAYSNPAWANHLQNLLPYIARNISLPAKIKLIEGLVKDREKKIISPKIRNNSDKLLLGFLSAADSLLELRCMLEHANLSHRIQDITSNSMIISMICIVEMGQEISRLKVPTQANSRTPGRVVCQRLNDVHNYLSLAQEILNNNKKYKGCWAYKQFTIWVRENQKYFSSELSQINITNRKTHRALSLLNLMSKKLSIESTAYVLLDMREITPEAGIKTCAWTLTQMRAAGKLIKTLPHRELLLSPRIFRIMIDVSKGYLGRYDGKTLFLHWTSFGLREDKTSKSDLKLTEMVLFHEFGHALSWNSAEDVKICPLTWRITNSMGKNVFFGSYLKFSGWTVIPEKIKYKIFKNPLSDNGYLLRIDHKEFTLNEPEYFDGKVCIFSANTAELKKESEVIKVYIREATAKLPTSGYDVYNPFEEWSEGFRQYVQNPIWLLKIAPHFAYYFELLYRKYTHISLDEISDEQSKYFNLDYELEYIDAARELAYLSINQILALRPRRLV